MKKTLHLLHLSAWAGMVGPALFVLIFTIEGWIRPGYKPLAMYISELSLGPRGWIQIVNFIVFGILLLAFSRGIASAFQTGKASRSGRILLTLMADLFILSGPFVMDPTNTPPDQASIQGTIHNIAGGLVFLLMPITCFVYLPRFRVDRNWRSFQWWTLALGIVEAAAAFLFTMASKVPQLQTAFSGWLGLIQRAALVPFMIWLFVFGLSLLHRIESG